MYRNLLNKKFFKENPFKELYMGEDENYEQGPLLALYKLSERFYKH